MSLNPDVVWDDDIDPTDQPDHGHDTDDTEEAD